MVIRLKLYLRSNKTWCQVWLMNLIVYACMDIGCVRALTLVGISNPNGVSHRAWFKMKGKARHANFFELGLMVNLYLNLNKRLPGSWTRVPLLYFPFCLKIALGRWTSVGEISQVYHWHAHLRYAKQALHNIDCAFMATDKVNSSEPTALWVSWTTTSLLFTHILQERWYVHPFISLSLIHEFEWVPIFI
jgi:hypothetical protein